MGDNGCASIVDRRVARQIDGNVRHGERLRNLHDRAEHQLRLHRREGDIPQLLPAILDAVNGGGFVHALVHRLQACNEGQEACAQAEPQLNDNQHRHDVLLCLHPQNRLVDDIEVQQDTVQIAVAVAGQNQVPDHVGVAADGRRVENQRQERAHPAVELVDNPREQQAQHIADRAGNDSENQRVFERNDEDFVIQQELDVVLPADELRLLQHVPVREGNADSHQHRQHGEEEEQDEVRRHQQVGRAVLPDGFAKRLTLAMHQGRIAHLTPPSSCLPSDGAADRIPCACS